jgi:hypothetical protein
VHFKFHKNPLANKRDIRREGEKGTGKWMKEKWKRRERIENERSGEWICRVIHIISYKL